MGEEQSIHSVRQLSESDTDYLRALHLAMDAQPSEQQNAAKPVAELLAAAQRQAGSLNLVFGAYRNQHLESTVVAFDGGGSSALVYVPRLQTTDSARQATLACLQALHAEAKVRKIKILEALLESDAHEAARSLESVGFRFLTRLIYLNRAIPGQEVKLEVADDLTWIEYAPKREEIFCQALEATYTQSLDCQELTGLRTTKEILAGHRTAGLFDPSRWWAVLRENQPAGVLLLCGVPDQPSLEIAYVGVAQPVRGMGVANALLKRAIATGRHENVTNLTLAVDRRNLPARRLYRRWLFRPIAMRDAWIATSHTA